jgi:protein TonB
MSMLLLIGLSVVASQLSQAAPVGPKPIGSPGSWITPDDYPKSARSRRAAGTTRFMLSVNAEGRVVDCIVTQSSGNEGLDAVTCALLGDRARFTPAQDRERRPIPGTYRSAVVWQMPPVELLPLTAATSSIEFDVDPTGKPSGCLAKGNVPGGQSPEKLCELMTSGTVQFEPASDKAGKPLSRHVTIRTDVSVTDSKPTN